MMRLLAPLLLSSSAAATTIYTSPNAHYSVSTSTLSPISARLLLAQRAGVEEYHIADLSRAEVIDTINTYGLATPLFTAQEDQTSRRRAFVLYQELLTDTPISLPTANILSLSPAPSAAETLSLYLDLARQIAPSMPADDTTLLASLKQNRILASSVPTIDNGFAVLKTREELEALFAQFGASWDITAVVISPLETGDEQATYGTYTLPRNYGSDLLRKRSTMQRGQPSEAPLELSTSGLAAIADTASLFPFASSSNSTHKPLKGILPSCFPSLASCQSSTLNCTGHGACSLKYTDKSASSSSKAAKCYSCGCAPTVTKNKDGHVSTTYWGGPACQKRDVSFQFWLIVLFTVGLVGLIGFAVGNLVTMGGEELPSVIGAGVSGPVKR